jgi:hypothetical protein
VDGPHHFTRNERERLVGNVLWKQRVLGAAGWRVLNVNAYHFGRLRGREERREYLIERLKKCTLQQ